MMGETATNGGLLKSVMGKTREESFDFVALSMITLPKTNSSPLKMDFSNRKVVFQPSIFRGELLVSGRVSWVFLEVVKNFWAAKSQLGSLARHRENSHLFAQLVITKQQLRVG